MLKFYVKVFYMMGKALSGGAIRSSDRSFCLSISQLYIKVSCYFSSISHLYNKLSDSIYI